MHTPHSYLMAGLLLLLTLPALAADPQAQVKASTRRWLMRLRW